MPGDDMVKVGQVELVVPDTLGELAIELEMTARPHQRGTGTGTRPPSPSPSLTGLLYQSSALPDSRSKRCTR